MWCVHTGKLPQVGMLTVKPHKMQELLTAGNILIMAVNETGKLEDN